ncbi:hypothetical protein ELQ90_11715 [Labedella phragmitis]|uniref:Uncharacterized protein n=1 Tax=Labedella phragmitis TaxID=2498849 RepID=A0A3S3Z6V6_9MICO|nr:hypothetical protein [Labedella phragmitis]RWZ50004.1 hypothetical protein ELQ90_11715 [Labedella phragmitis]
MQTTLKKNGERQPRRLRNPLRAAGAIAVAAGMLIGATGCGYSQNWGTTSGGSTTNGTTLNWQYPTPLQAP